MPLASKAFLISAKALRRTTKFSPGLVIILMRLFNVTMLCVGSPEATRRAFNKRFLLDLAADWQQHGREVFKRVRRESPAAHWMRTLLINADALILLAWALARYPLAEILKFQAPSSPSRARKFRACYHILDTYAAKTSAGSATADFTIPTSSPVF